MAAHKATRCGRAPIHDVTDDGSRVAPDGDESSNLSVMGRGYEPDSFGTTEPE
jgi:hypothetical protein